MSVRQVTRCDGRLQRVRTFWMIDIDFEHPDGRRERLRKVSPIQTRRGAEEYERRLRAELLNPKRGSAPAPVFGEFVEKRWLPTYPVAAGNRKSTIEEKEGHLKRYLKPAFATVRLDQICGERLDRFFADLAARIGPKTRKNVRATLRRILASAVEWGLLDALPKIPAVKVPEPSFDFLSVAEARALVAAARDSIECALFLFALHTGARAGELLALQWRDIDLAARLIVIRRSSVRGVVGPTKSGRERKVPTTTTLRCALEAIRHRRSANVFCKAAGEPFTIWMLHYRLRRALERAGIRRVRLHDLRHTFASHLVSEAVPIRQVQEWLGHSSITMTMRYSHLAPGNGAELIERLDRLPRA